MICSVCGSTAFRTTEYTSGRDVARSAPALECLGCGAISLREEAAASEEEMQAAIDANKSLDPPTLVAWMEQNGRKLRGTAGSTFAVAAGSHFMMGADSMAIVRRPDEQRPADKLVERLNNC